MIKSKNDLVLVVEDDDIDAMLLQRVFKRLKPEIKLMRCEDGVAALEALNSCRPDLIIMDIRMPRMDGLETLELIKKDKQLRSIPVIMMSSSNNPSDIANSYDCLANAYVVKGVAVEDGCKMEALVHFWLETAVLNEL